MNKKQLEKYARERGFDSTAELAAAILYKAADAEDLAAQLSDAKRKLDLAVLREKESKAQLAELKKTAKDERPDEEHIDDLLSDIVRATALAVEDGRAKLDGRKRGVMWRLT